MKKLVGFLAVTAVPFLISSCGGDGGSSNTTNSSNGGTTPSYSTNLSATSLQEQMFLNNMSFQTMSNILDIQNQTSNAIISNIGSGWDIEYNYYSVKSPEISNVLPVLIKHSIDNRFISAQGSVSKTVSCDNGSITTTLNWTNNNCDFNNLNKEYCFKNNDITLDVAYNSCYIQQSSLTIKGNNTFSMSFPANPNTNNGDYLPSTLKYTMKNLSFEFPYNNSSYVYTLNNLVLDLDFNNTKLSLDMTLELKENGNTKLKTQNLKITYDAISSTTYSYSIDGYIYGSQNSTPTWYKFETKTPFTMQKIGSKICATAGKLVINDVITVEVIKDSNGSYLYKGTDKNGQTNTVSACN